MTAKSRRGSLFLYFRTMHAISRARTPARAALRAALSTAPSFPGPPTTAAWPPFDAHGGDQYRLYAALHEAYGDGRFQPKSAFGIDIVTLFHPEDIQDVIRAEGPLPRGLGQALLPFTRFYQEHAPDGLNLGRIDGPDWKKVRTSMARHMMPPKEAQSFIPNLERVMQDCSAHLPAHAREVDEYVPS